MIMKKIGLVGGTGLESTLMYYKELNTRIDKITHGAHMPESRAYKKQPAWR
jgi:aspartate racemase